MPHLAEGVGELALGNALVYHAQPLLQPRRRKLPCYLPHRAIKIHQAPIELQCGRYSDTIVFQHLSPVFSPRLPLGLHAHRLDLDLDLICSEVGKDWHHEHQVCSILRFIPSRSRHHLSCLRSSLPPPPDSLPSFLPVSSGPWPPVPAPFRTPPRGKAGLTTPRVRTLTGKEIELDIEPDYKVARIKERVEEKEGIPPVQQRLIYGGKQMYDISLTGVERTGEGERRCLVPAHVQAPAGIRKQPAA